MTVQRDTENHLNISPLANARYVPPGFRRIHTRCPASQFGRVSSFIVWQVTGTSGISILSAVPAVNGQDQKAPMLKVLESPSARSFGRVCGVTTYAAALGIGIALRAASSWVAESLAEVALSGGGGWPHGSDWANAVEEDDALLDEGRGVGWGDLD